MAKFINMTSLLTLLIAILNKYILDKSFELIITTNFGIFEYNLNYVKYFESIIISAIIAIILIFFTDKNAKISNIFAFMIYIFLINPFLTLYGHMDLSRIFVYVLVIAFVLTVVIAESSNLESSNVNLRKTCRSRYAYLAVVILVTLFVYAQLILGGGWQGFYFNLLDVYGVREQFFEKLGPFMGYLVPWQANVLNMSLLGVAIIRRSYLLFATAGCMQLIIFLFTGFKSYLFAPILVIILLLIMNNVSARKLFAIFMSGTTILLLALACIYYYFNDVVFVSILMRRLFFVPAFNHYIYYDFFENSDKLLLSKSILKSFVTSPYTGKIENIIALEYYNIDGSANVGYMGDSFAQFGYVGMIIVSILLGWLLRYLNTITKDITFNFYMPLLIIPMMSLINSSFQTVLITHGLVFSILILLFCPSFINKKVEL